MFTEHLIFHVHPCLNVLEADVDPWRLKYLDQAIEKYRSLNAALRC